MKSRWHYYYWRCLFGTVCARMAWDIPRDIAAGNWALVVLEAVLFAFAWMLAVGEHLVLLTAPARKITSR